ncbi:ATPase family AAA domain-containing protein 5 [Poecilia latipinna]|uniref:ATPase family AAA domain containing 5a n=1 Tax=Poecilia latipinna TaxID=48699 RepID=A0A3B3UUQ9_9TELE|nr:PREDICTED: ATPase family AAA domain-containing protein 5-like [Poecilia latipinna]
MAGVVAMASVIEDFDTQPCKKSRKDVKQITNYFSPVPKPVEKPFSPPRSSNIMDYFSRKTPSSKEKTSPPQDLKENSQKPQPEEKRTNAEVGRKSSEKRGRKTSRAARKLVPTEDVGASDDCLVVEETQESKGSDAAVSHGTLGSDTAALLLKLSAETCESEICKTVSDEKTERDSPQQRDRKSENTDDVEAKRNTTALSPRLEVKQVKKAARKPTKRQQKESKHPEPEEKEADKSLCDVSMNVSLGETSELNSSTVTVSFEDFVRSHSQSKDVIEDPGEEDDSKNKEKAEELNCEQLDVPKTEESVGPVQVSPRTLTIQAEVHAVSPKQENVKAVGKFASIFTRRKGAGISAEPAASPPADDGRHLPSPSSASKRRSNVVLQEEDLELAVIESESTPKCSEAERKQFMAAFKQPSLDGSKTKPVKNQSKQKQAEEKTVEAAEDGDVSVPSAEQGPQESKASKKKSGKKGRNKANDKQEATHTSPTVKETEVIAAEAEDDKDVPPITSTPTVPALRRSRRETVVKKSPEKTPTSPVRKTRRQNESKETLNAASPQISPVKMSTPKTRRSRHGVFVAQMVCPPDAKESPIRIRLSRIHKTVPASKTESGNDISTSSNNKMLNESKKRQQAKKLVEKAKMIQQSKKTTEKEMLRRSSRTKTSVKKSYYEDEDSVLCIEDLTDTSQSAPEKTKTQKALRSLNEVLGKAAPSSKATPGSKVASFGQDKSARKASAVISIFDDSSGEGSDNSQDDEQFRARREFLKSGLPESFRKQIAKTAATKEAYSASSSSFQPVSHTTQPPSDCSLWSLPWPESSLLGHLKDIWSHKPNPPISVCGSLCVKTEPACRKANEKASVWRPEISESDRQLLMTELCSENPHFPAQTVFTRLQKRRADHQQHLTASEPEAVTIEDSCVLVHDEAVGGKRKRKEDERENNVKVAKKQKSKHSEENVSPAEQEPPRRGGRTRRSQRSRMKEEEDETKEKSNPKLNSAPSTSEDDSVVVVDDSTLEADIKRKESVKEELLWTDKYQPQLSADIIDNTPAVKRLYSWLKDWKLRADRDERKNQKAKKQEEGSYDSEWDCGGEDCQDADDTLCNTVLITGPTGVGKTAAVYACAQELGFKVFEVNASSQRSGRLILSQLKEATQSHQVDNQGVSSHKPAYFNSYGLSSSTGSVRPGSSPRRVSSPRKVVSSPRKNPQSPRGAKKGGLAPTSLAKFFKVQQPANKEPQKPEQTAPSKKAIKANESSNDKNKSPATSSPKQKSSEEQSKKTATSLILFEEVDVIFDDDSGFLAAIKTFMSTTKRPVILTTSDPAFSAMFDGSFEEIHFKKPSVVNVSSYLQLLCLAEDIRTHPSDISSLLKLTGCDVRQSLLQLQFWARSAAGRPSTKPLAQTGRNEIELKPEAADKSVAVTSSLPRCDAGCTESKLGLLNIEPDGDIWELLRSQSLMKATVCLELLADGRRRGVDLLYSNMEKLLPLPLTQLSTSKLYTHKHCLPESQDLRPVSPKQQLSSSSLPSDTLPPGVGLLHAAESADLSDSCSPVKVSSRMKKNKKRHHLPTRDALNSDSDSEDGFPSLSKRQDDPHTEKVKERFVSERVRRKPLTAEEQIKTVPVSQCLQSIADFWDNMSYVDSSLRFHPDGLNSYRRSSFSAAIKDGMTDESRVENGRESWTAGSCVVEIQAAVEGLSFHKCQASVAKAWDKVQQLEGELRKEAAEELTLPVASHREGYSFTQDGLSRPELVLQRTEMMENLFDKVFGTLGNRQAAALDYLPAMRTICRSEQLKEQGKVKRRFLHYLDAIHLGLEKSTQQILAEDFP